VAVLDEKDDSFNSSQQQVGLSESLLNLKVMDLLKVSSPHTERGATPTSSETRPTSPSSVRNILYPMPKVQPSLHRTIDAAKYLFSNPLSNIPNQIFSKDILLPQFVTQPTKPCKVAIHSRIGCDAQSSTGIWMDEEDGEQSTCFVPRIVGCDEYHGGRLPATGLEYCRQWFLAAQGHGTVIQLFCIPLGWARNNMDNSEDTDDGDSDCCELPYYLTSKLVLPTGASIVDLGFYGDDGKSSLSSGKDSGTGIEGRQKLGFLLHQTSPSSEPSLELWVVSYDSLFWQPVPFDHSSLAPPSEVDDKTCRNVFPLIQSKADEEEESMENDFVYAQTRKISGMASTADACRLLLCGSRGIGGSAVISREGIVSLDILDLEEDEDDVIE